MIKFWKVTGIIGVIFLISGIQISNQCKTSTVEKGFVNQFSTWLTNAEAHAAPILPQDKRMHIGACSCGNGTYAVGWSCSQSGDECYTSSGCFC